MCILSVDVDSYHVHNFDQTSVIMRQIRTTCVPRRSSVIEQYLSAMLSSYALLETRLHWGLCLSKISVACLCKTMFQMHLDSFTCLMILSMFHNHIALLTIWTVMLHIRFTEAFENIIVEDFALFR